MPQSGSRDAFERVIGIVGHPTTPDADDLARQEDDVRLAARAARHFGTSLLAHLPPT